MSNDSQSRWIARRERIDAGIVLTDRCLQYFPRVESIRRAIETGELGEVAYEAVPGTRLDGHLRAVQKRRAGQTLSCVHRRVLTLRQSRLDQCQPHFGFGMFPPNIRQALGLVPVQVPVSWSGPEHFTFGVLQGVL